MRDDRLLVDRFVEPRLAVLFRAVLLRPVLFRAVPRLAVLFFAVLFFAVLFLAVLRLAVLFRAVPFLAVLRFAPPFFAAPRLRAGGTFAPFSRASERPIAIACLRLVTLRVVPPPRLPLFRVPFLRRRIALSTLFPAACPYFRPPVDRDRDFVAI